MLSKDLDGSAWGVLGIDLDGSEWSDIGYRFRWEWVGVLGIDGNGCRILAIDF